VALIGSSGEGGVKPHRRDFGEAVENLTGSGAYHWMTGNFLKYGAEESVAGRQDADDIPIDAHHRLTLCAPAAAVCELRHPGAGRCPLARPARQLATVAVGEVVRLLGARDLGVSGDYRTATMPPINTGMLEGGLAWRQPRGPLQHEPLHRLGQQADQPQPMTWPRVLGAGHGAAIVSR
jgi:hypothetical protein